MANDAVGKNIIQKANTLSFQSPIALLAIQQGGLFCTVWPFRVKSPFFREFFSRYSVFALSSKTSLSKFQCDQESRRQRTTLWMCYFQIIIYLFIYLFIFNIPPVCIVNRNPYDFSDSDSDFDEEEDDKKNKKKKKKKVSRGDGFGCCLRFSLRFFYYWS